MLNADDERVAAMTRLTPERALTFGAGDADLSLEDLVLDRLGRPRFSLAYRGDRARWRCSSSAHTRR